MDAGATGGGSLYLAELIDEHGAALSADFLREYHLPLWEALDWPPRIVLALVEDLLHVPHTALPSSLNGDPETRGWGVDRHLVANLIDMTALAGGVTEKNSKKAFAQPRPGVKKKQGTPLTALFPGRGKGLGGISG